MNLTQLRHAIFASTGGLMLTAVVSVVWSFGSLDAEPVATVSSSRGSLEQGTELVENESPGIAQKNRFGQKLQKSLYDPPKKAPTPRTAPTRPAVKTTPPPPRPPKPPRLDWRLVGTIIESGKSVAIFSDANGKTDIRAIGEEVELMPAGVLVRQIDSEEVTLEVRGKESKLRLKKDFEASGNGRQKNSRRNNR